MPTQYAPLHFVPSSIIYLFLYSTLGHFKTIYNLKAALKGRTSTRQTYNHFHNVWQKSIRIWIIITLNTEKLKTEWLQRACWWTRNSAAFLEYGVTHQNPALKLISKQCWKILINTKISIHNSNSIGCIKVTFDTDQNESLFSLSPRGFASHSERRT